MNKGKEIVLNLKPRAFYVDPIFGSDKNSGLSNNDAWKTLTKINEYHLAYSLQPGDRILLKAGEVFKGSLLLVNAIGTADNPIVISSYSINSKQHTHPKIIPLTEKQKYCIHCKNCEHFQIENLEISKGRIYFTFNSLTNDGETQNKEFNNFLFKNLSLTNIHAGDSTKGCIEFNILEEQLTVKNVKIIDCKFENTLGHAVSTGISRTIVYLQNADSKKEFYKNIVCKNNVTQNTFQSAFMLCYVSDGEIKSNKIHSSGMFLLEGVPAPRGSSGAEIHNCENLVIDSNEIVSSYGLKHSAGILVGRNNKNIKITNNISKNNYGGFVFIMGGTSNVQISNNFSYNDGLRTKTDTTEVTKGRIFTFSNYVEWCPLTNENVFKKIHSVYIVNNTIVVDKGDKSINIAFFGDCETISLTDNILIGRIFHKIGVTVNSSIKDLEISNNTTNTEWRITNEDDCPTSINSLLLNNQNIQNSSLNEAKTLSDYERVFLKAVAENYLQDQSIDNLDWFHLYEKPFEGVNESFQNNKELFCVLCNAPRKTSSLMEYFSGNTSNVHFLNEKVARAFNTSGWEIMSWFSTPSRILANSKAKTILSLNSTETSETAALEAFLLYLSQQVKDGSVLLLGEHFLTSSSSFFDVLYSILHKTLTINVLLLFDNVFEDAKFKLIKRIESASNYEQIQHLDINTYIQHCSKSVFPITESIIASIATKLDSDHFLAKDLQYCQRTDQSFKKLWKGFANTTSPKSFNKLFETLSASKYPAQIRDEVYINPLFLTYIINKLKANDLSCLKEELTEIKKFQMKYLTHPSANHSMLNFKPETIRLCNDYCKNLENIANFNFFGKTMVINNGYENTTKLLKINFYEVNLINDLIN